MQAEEELRSAKAQLEVVYDELKKDVDAAARIQRSMLPTAAPRVDGLRFAWRFQPCAELAGDFLNVFRLDDRRLGIYVLDVVGHGAAAALLSVTLSRWLSPAAAQSFVLSSRAGNSVGARISPPAEVAALLNNRLFTDSPRPQYFTMIYGVLDTETREFRYVSAGHPGPVYLPRDGEAQMLEATSVPIGLLDGVDYQEATLELRPGDQLFLFTDGLTESLSPDGREFGEERLLEKLREYRGLEVPKTIHQLMKDVEDWRGKRPMRDDTSLLGLEVTTKETKTSGLTQPAGERRRMVVAH